MPPSASSNRPMRRAIAPVKAPFSWPNSSLSTSPAGRAAQLTLISGLAARRLVEWIARAISSLPGAGLAVDQDGGVGRRHPADLVEHRHQRGDSADDLLEIVDRLDLFLEVEVLLLEPARSASASTRSVMSTQIEWTASIRPSAPRIGLIQTLIQSGLAVAPAHLQLEAGDLLRRRSRREMLASALAHPAGVSAKSSRRGGPTSSAAGIAEELRRRDG